MNRLLIVVVATAFNLLFEYSIRGLNSLAVRPILLVILTAFYASLFTIEDDLIRRFRLKDYHLTLLAFVYGIVYQGFVSGAAFVQPQFLGIRWSYSLFVIIVWWGIIQSILTFYLANRLVPRDWSAPLLSRLGWAVALVVNVAVVLAFQLIGGVPRGQPIGYLMIAVVFVLALILFRLSVARGERRVPGFQRSLVMDVLSFSTVAVFLLSGLFLRGGTAVANEASVVNATAARLVPIWTMIVAAATVLYRLLSRRPIPV